MPKGGRSSATSSTRKKHAKQATTPSKAEWKEWVLSQPPPPTEEKEKLTKKQRAQKKKEPRVKSYVPPVKPPPVQPDPLETTGLIHSLPPELVIVLRSFGKKAHITKIRALEELQSGWIDKRKMEGDDEYLTYVLVEMLPVWLHHVPALFIHSSRRVRLLAATAHLSLLQIPPTRDQILSYLRDTASESQLESILGTWCLAAHDIEKSVSTQAIKSWIEVVSPDSHPDKLTLEDHRLSLLSSFVQRAILDPNEVYINLNPTQPVVPASSSSKTVRSDEPDAASRSKAEELEEDEQDRKARLRVGGFGALRWIMEIPHFEPQGEFIEFLQNPALWSSLYHAAQCPFADIEGFGSAQPNTRKAAWAVVQTLLSISKSRLEPLLPVISVAVLRSAWTEPDPNVHAIMWQPLLKFLKEFPSAWDNERAYEYSNGNRSEASEGEESGDEENEKQRNSSMQSAAYHEFLSFLELGCLGSPLQGYPTVVVILSTIPSSILMPSLYATPQDDLFTSIWKAVDSRALSSLQRSAASAAFLSCLLESMVFIVKRIRNGALNAQKTLEGANSGDISMRLVCDQLEKVWNNLGENTLRIEQRAAARLVGQTLLSLQQVDTGLFNAAWETHSAALQASRQTNPILLSVFLKSFHDQFRHVVHLREAASTLTSSILMSAVRDCKALIGSVRSDTPQLDGDGLAKATSVLANMLDRFRDGLFSDSSITNLLDEMMAEHTLLLLRFSSSLLLAYLMHRKDDARTLKLWHSLLSTIAQNPDDSKLLIMPLLDAAQRGSLPQHLKPKGGEVDVLIENLLSQTLAGDSSQLQFVQQILQRPDYFMSEEGYTTSLRSIETVVLRDVDITLRDSETSISIFDQPLRLITTLLQNPPRHFPAHSFEAVIPDVFILAYLLPVCDESQNGHPIFQTAKDIWDHWQKSQPEAQVKILDRIKTKLKAILCDTQLRPLPYDVFEMLWGKPPGLDTISPFDIIPLPRELEEWLNRLPSDPIHPSIAVIDPLLHAVSATTERLETPESFDNRGFSMYARTTEALLRLFLQDRRLARKNVWALWHFQALALYTQDFVHIPSASNMVFGAQAIHEDLETLISRIEQVTTYILTSSDDDEWRKISLSAMLSTKPLHTENDLSMFLLDSVQRSRDSENPRDRRILHNILQHIFHGVTKTEADDWLLLARKMELTAPQTSITIVFTVTNMAPETARLDRYRNELAANLFGIPPSKANTEGLLTLQKLTASAPNPDSDVVFLPQPRAVNIAKTCQQWIASDEDILEEVESAITLLFYHLAPILQDVPGAHWDFVFDILENNLESSSLADDATLVTLARTLRFIILVQDLSSTNKSLRANWEERNVPILTSIRNLASLPLDHLEVSFPRSTCRSLVLSILKDVSSSLIDQDTFSKICHLVMDPVLDVQQMGYHFLTSAAKIRTEHLIIEAAVDSESTFVAQLPIELVTILQQSIPTDDITSETHNVLGYLLAWMLLFDLFQDTSVKVRSSYIEQLRNADIIFSHFIPTIVGLLQLDQGPLRVFKLEAWAVDEFYIEYLEPNADFALHVLAAHLYYRALLTVPSLIHTWILECKDRQLSTTITGYTSQHFSPVIIRAELAHVRSPEAAAILADDNLSIKVASSVNEVAALYSVDDHQLEIKLKIPPDWPLHKIEIKDTKRVGVDESRWRAWILAVQQTIWVQNGRIVDGLSLFKKNVTLHFEGQVECAICYSIISVMDGSLPRKPCRTCKNRFHAGCLYKWLKTSHSSSCPLCRSDIF